MVHSGELTIRATRDNGQVRFGIRGPARILEQLDAHFFPADQDGELIGPFSLSSSYAYSSGTPDVQGHKAYTLPLSDTLASIAVKLIVQWEEIHYPFTFRDIPLTHHAATPAAHVALEYGNIPQPVSLECVGIDRSNANFPKVTFKVVNHANKGILRIEGTFLCRDQTDALLKDFPGELEGRYTEFGQEVIVAKGAHANVQTNAFFMPKETTRIDFQIKRIEFDDYSIH